MIRTKSLIRQLGMMFLRVVKCSVIRTPNLKELREKVLKGREIWKAKDERSRCEASAFFMG